jgi:hypothetical protein
MASSPKSSPDSIELEQPSRAGSTLAKLLAPEDIRRGDYVTPLDVLAEVPSFFWCCDDAAISPREVPVRMRFLSATGGVPLKVRRVCLPFVLVKHPRGEQHTLDTRKCRLARLDKRFAKAAWKVCKKSAPKVQCEASP